MKNSNKQLIKDIDKQLKVLSEQLKESLFKNKPSIMSKIDILLDERNTLTKT